MICIFINRRLVKFVMGCLYYGILCSCIIGKNFLCFDMNRFLIFIIRKKKVVEERVWCVFNCIKGG